MIWLFVSVYAILQVFIVFYVNNADIQLRCRKIAD